MDIKAACRSLSKATGDGSAFRQAFWWWLLVLGLLGLLLINLGTRGLNEPDEGRYSNIAGEMLEGGHGWWEPRMSDFAHYDKPPLVYWFTAGALKLCGRTEWAVRLPSLLGAMMALIGLGWVAWRLYGSFVAWWAVLFCGTMGQFWVLGRMLTPDMLLTGFSCLTIGFWAEARHRRARGWWWWGCVLCATLAWWTKATAALVPLLGLTAGLIMTQDRDGWRAWRPLQLGLLVLVAGSPWYLTLMYRHPELQHFFLGRELAGRIVGHPDGRHGPIYYHVAFSLVAWMPWWPAALAALVLSREQIKERLRRERWQGVPIELWIVITGLAVFSLMSSKLVTYTMPFAPWAALFCARVLIGSLAGERRIQMVGRALGAAAACTLIYVVTSFALPLWESRMGVGSSMREIAWQLRHRHAAIAYVDRYAAGMEFYFGEAVFYVIDRMPRQISSDTGNCEALGERHFLTPAELPDHLGRHVTDGVWFVRYKGRTNSPLTVVMQRLTVSESLRVGDYVLDCVRATRDESLDKTALPKQERGIGRSTIGSLQFD